MSAFNKKEISFFLSVFFAIVLRLQVYEAIAAILGRSVSYLMLLTWSATRSHTTDNKAVTN